MKITLNYYSYHLAKGLKNFKASKTKEQAIHRLNLFIKNAEKAKQTLTEEK